MKIYKLQKMSLLKIAVLAAGLAAAVLAVTMSPQVAHAFPNEAQDCANCHTGSTSTSTTATPSTTSPAAGATYTVGITLAANPTGGNSGYAIIPDTAGTGTTNAGNTAALLSYTANMTAPASAGTYRYTVYTNQGSKATGQTGSATYTITVAAGSTTTPVTTTTTPATTTTTPATTPPDTTTPTTIPPVGMTSTSSVVGPIDVHGPYATNAPQCAFCHRVHAAKAPNLLAKGSQSTMCFTCHDGLGANANVALQYSLTRPVNNPAAREYYSHDALAASSHTLSAEDEFGVATNGVVINRHSECADCHNSHQATVKATRDSAETATGWEASGRLEGVSGVKVDNSRTAGVAPAYTFLSGVDTNVVPANAVTREYQLCFKCHSGFTTLTSNDTLAPSKYALDKGVEFNPANPSFHPVEAPGKNTTTAMGVSLSKASSPTSLKQWTFTTGSTIRCSNCHASSIKYPLTPPAAGGALPPHTSQYRGILLRNYRDRDLKPSGEAYSDADFALCYLCHTNSPFKGSGDNTATNFPEHAKHVSSIGGSGGTDLSIDTPGAGQGKAVCAECHFRLHGTPSESRLVNFAPNVGGARLWTKTTSGGSCTLTCHGFSHSSENY